jgi:hypothetical protein
MECRKPILVPALFAAAGLAAGLVLRDAASDAPWLPFAAQPAHAAADLPPLAEGAKPAAAPAKDANGKYVRPRTVVRSFKFAAPHEIATLPFNDDTGLGNKEWAINQIVVLGKDEKGNTDILVVYEKRTID